MDKLKMWIQENIHKMDFEEPDASTWDNLKYCLSKPEENDPLKSYIAKNSDKLEIETPAVASWDEINRFFVAKKRASLQKLNRSLVYLSAACVTGIISLGILKYRGISHTKDAIDVAEKSQSKKQIWADKKLTDTTNTDFKKEHLATTQPSFKQPPREKIKYKSSTAASSRPVKEHENPSLPLEVLQVQNDYDQLIAGQIAYTKSLAVYGENADYFERFMNDFKMLEKQEKELRMSIIQLGLQANSIDNLATIYQQKLTVLKKLQNEIAKTSTRNKNITDTVPAYINL